jgi:Uma2 family endonuclease
MATVVTEASHYPGMPPAGEWTVEHLSALPDDGIRHELVDGVLFVTGVPIIRHQVVSMALSYVLRAACPPELQVLAAPTDYQPDERNSVQPDLFVARTADLDFEGSLRKPPLLIVEILSRSTRRRDLTIKKSLYQDLGVPAYWVFDPDVPSLTVLEAVDGAYRQSACLVGHDELLTEWPYPARLCPAEIAEG